MCTNFDEMDIEPNSERQSPLSEDTRKNDERRKEGEEELQSQLLTRTVPLDDGSIGYVFTCTRSGPLATWRCHACNFVDTWKNFLRHIDIKWHFDNMSKFQHSRANFSKVKNAIPDISKGQPLPPGMEDVIAGPCQILKTLENYDQPLIGLEFLLELNIIDLKEPRYLCLLCDKRGDPRSILVHLTSQSHYVWYLRKYFKKFFNLIDKLPKSVECRGNVCTVTSHLIAKLEEKYGRLQPTATREDVTNTEQRSILLQKIDNGMHFTETSEDSYLEEMLSIEYVQNTHLLVKNFPLKPKTTNTQEKDDFASKSLFNKGTKTVNRKQLRGRDSNDHQREESPEVLFVSSIPAKYSGGSNADRGRERSPRSRSHRSSRSRSPPRHRSSRSRSPHRSRSPNYYRRKYGPPPPHHRPPGRYSRSRSRSPYSKRYRSRSPHDRYHRRSPHARSPHSRYPPKPPGYHHRSPENHRRGPDEHYRGRSPTFSAKPSSYPPPKMRDRSRSRSPPPPHRGSDDRSPHSRPSHTSHAHQKNGSPRSGMEQRMPSASLKEPSKDKEIHKAADRTSYLKALAETERSLNEEMKKYEETPENHPAYQEEWKKFWCNRFKELQSEGKVNPHTYDYKPEWIDFWNVRMKELFKKELVARRNALKFKYGVPDNEDTNDTPMKVEEEVKKTPEEEKKPVDNIKTMWKELTGFEIREEPARRKSPSPWEDDNEDSKDDNKSVAGSKHADKNPVISILEDGCTQPISPEPLSSISDTESIGDNNSVSRSRSRSRSRSASPFRAQRSRSRSRSHSKPRTFPPKEVPAAVPKEEYPFRKPSKKIHFDNPLNIITVLRQLSVLEFQLGSYASHVIKLLSSGLAMEKIKPQSSIDMLTTENVMFLELVKEKLKGQLLAGVVQKGMVKATLFCIKNIEELMLLAPKMKPTAPPPIPAPPPALIYGTDPGPNPGNSMQNPQAMGGPYGGPVYGGYQANRGKRFQHNNRNQNRRNNDDFHRPQQQHDQTRTYDDMNKHHKPGSAPPAAAPQDEIVIDEKLIAVQIAEVLTSQGRTDVSEEELRTLINTVVENLKEEQRNRLSAKEKGITREPVTTSVLAAAVVSTSSTPSAPEIMSIPAGFNLNDVPNSTLAILQDAFDNASSNKTAPAIETLPEAEVIQLLRNFKNITRMKQEKLIEYLRKLEDTDPQRVEELKKYVNVL